MSAGAREPRAGADVPAGLCDDCAHQLITETGRGSRFSRCARHRDEPERYPKYPRLPVTSCAGFERARPAAGGAAPG